MFISSYRNPGVRIPTLNFTSLPILTFIFLFSRVPALEYTCIFFLPIRGREAGEFFCLSSNSQLCVYWTKRRTSSRALYHQRMSDHECWRLLKLTNLKLAMLDVYICARGAPDNIRPISCRWGECCSIFYLRAQLLLSPLSSIFFLSPVSFWPSIWVDQN